MPNVRKFFLRNHIEMLVGIILVICYFISRFYQLKYVPIFLDELVYARWAQLGAYNPNLRLISLSDGKQPLFIWLSIFVMHFVSNPIAAERFISIAAGFGTLGGLYVLSFLLFKNKWCGIITVFFYILLPFSLVLNRLGIYENLVGMLLVWSICGEILLARYLRLDTALVLGLVLGAGLLTKSTNMIAIALFPLSLLFVPFTQKNYKNNFVKWVGLVAISMILSYLYSLIMALSLDYSNVYDKNYQFIYHLRELTPYHAFAAWIPHLILFVQWLVIYCTFPVLFLMLISAFNHTYRKEIIFLGLWFFIPLIWFGLFGRIVYTRYLYPFIILLLPLAGITMISIYTWLQNKKMIFAVIFLFCISCMLYSDYKIITDLKDAPLPKESLFEYVNGWPSGEGLQQIITYLLSASKDKPIYLVTDGVYGTIPSLAADIYFMNDPLIHHHPIDQFSKTIPVRFIEKAQYMPVYIFMNNTQDVPNWPMDLVIEHRKGSGNNYMRLYKVRSAAL